MRVSVNLFKGHSMYGVSVSLRILSKVELEVEVCILKKRKGNLQKALGRFSIIHKESQFISLFHVI